MTEKQADTRAVIGTQDCEPQLGCATTRDLLLEIKARGETELYYEKEGGDMAMGAASLLDSLPESMLEYRTVDSD